MALKILPSKLLPEIEDCVAALKSYSSSARGPIDDDLIALRLFEEKLESILSYGLKEKSGSHGQNISYWNYICACLASSKRSHEDITFVKSITSIKTSLGRSRAFIRFCLVQRCLADSLQSCFMELKISRDFYTEQSLPMQEKLWTALVTVLYELNDLNFDLSAGHEELDVSWPQSAKKSSTSSNTENALDGNLSAPNLVSVSNQAHYNGVAWDTMSCASSNMSSNFSNSISDPVKLNELTQENICLKKDVKQLEEEKSSLLRSIQTLQKECLILQQQLKSSHGNDLKKIESVQVEEEMEITDAPAVLSAVESLENGTPLGTSVVTDQCGSSSGSPNTSVKPKVKRDSTDSSKGAFQPHANEATPVGSSNFCTCGKTVKEIETNMYIPQNSVYVFELLMENKKVIDCIEDSLQKSDTNVVNSYVSRLKNIRNCLEAKFLSQCDKSKSSMDFNTFLENCVSCIKNLVTKQENVINALQEKVDLSVKGNENLFSKTKKLKDLLHSCGFLKIVNEKEIEVKNNLPPSISASPISINPCDDLLSEIAHDPVLKRIVVPLLPVLNSSFEKLCILNERMTELQCGLDSSQELNANIISRIRAQEMHLRGVSKEIEEAQQLVAVLRKQHQKLQSAEGILKYDLQEKRKLFTRLKQQLENTREDFNQVRIKNSKSEAEWQDLRNEFVQRNKQGSEESGFVDDKGIDEHETVFPNAAGDCTSIEVCEKDFVSDNSTEEFQVVPPKKSRLELLEEQCQSLYSSLLQKSQRRKDIDKRLENVCKTVQKRNKNSHLSSVATDLHTENSFEDTNDSLVPTSPEDMCQDVVFTPDVSISSPHSSPDVGSLNSECSCSLASICNDVNSLDNFGCDSPKVDLSTVFPPFSSDLNIYRENITENTNDSVIPASSENASQSTIFPSSAFVSRPHSSSDVGSVHSDCSSLLTCICNEANSSDSGAKEL